MDNPTSLIRLIVAVLARILQRNRANRMFMCLHLNSPSACVCVCVCMCVIYNTYRGRKRGSEIYFKELAHVIAEGWQSEICRVGQQARNSRFCSLESEGSLEGGHLPSSSRDFSLCL